MTEHGQRGDIQRWTEYTTQAGRPAQHTYNYALADLVSLERRRIGLPAGDSVIGMRDR